MKILIIRFSSLGDIILTEPVVRVLRQQYPDCDIDYVTKLQYRELLSFFEGINEIISAEDLFQTVKLIRKKKYDLIIDLQGKLNSIFVSLLAHSSKKVRYNKKRKLRTQIVRTKSGSIGSTVSLYFSALDKLGITGLYDKERLDLILDDYYPSLNVPEVLNSSTLREKIDYYSEVLADAKRKGVTTIGLFPGALHKTKRYPPDKFADMIALLPSDKYRFFLLGSSEERKLASEIDNRSNTGSGNWCGEFSITELIIIMNRLDIIVTNDSGPMHIASALGKKQIAIFGATSTRLGFKPHNKKAVVIQEVFACRPCSLHGGEKCPEGHFRCMNGIKAEKVAEAIEEISSHPKFMV